MPGYSQVFGGSAIYPSQTTYIALALTADVELSWPLEQQVGGDNIVADIMDLSTSTPGLSVILPDARQATNGFTALFNNVGAETVTIKSATGATLVSLTSGTAWQLYLTDNSTEGGTWQVFQYGASVSVSDAAALAGAGLVASGTTLNQSMPVTATAITPYNSATSDRANVIMWTGGVGVLNLLSPATVGANWYVNVRNSGSGNLTLTPAAGLIDDAATKVLAPGDSAIVYTDGANYYTIGAGGSASGTSFDFVTISVAGSGDYVLSGVNLNRIGYRFTGILTGTRNIVVPNTIQEYWIDNETTGAFSLFVKTLAQVPGVEVLQTAKAILYCDGVDVVNASSSAIAFPITVVQGGTGAITAAGARTNLGVPATTLTLTAGTLMTGGGDLSANRTFNVDLAGSPTWTGTHQFNIAPRIPLGSSAVPGLTFTGDTNTGIYSTGADNISFTTGGSGRGGISSVGTWAIPASSSGITMQVQGNSRAGQFYNFAGDTTSNPTLEVRSTAVAGGVFLSLCGNNGTPGTNDFALRHDGSTLQAYIIQRNNQNLTLQQNGTDRLILNTNAQIAAVNAGTAALPTWTFSGDPDTGMYRGAVADNLLFTTGGTLRVTIDTTAITPTLPIRDAAGSAAAPSYSFSTDTNSGMYSVGADSVGISAGGTVRLTVDTTRSLVAGQLQVASGSAGTPAYSFSGDTDTGFYRGSSGNTTVVGTATELQSWTYSGAGAPQILLFDGQAAGTCSLGIYGLSTATFANAGAATALPANPRGYLSIVIQGTTRKIPYYDV